MDTPTPPTLPAARDLNEFDSPDERVAAKHILGKSPDQAGALFRDNAPYFTEDLMWMGAGGFQFYVEAALRAMERDAFGDGTALDSFAAVIEFRLGNGGAELVPLAPRLAGFCKSVLSRSGHRDASPGDTAAIESRYRALLARLAPPAARHGD